jgi:hypothetical protein
VVGGSIISFKGMLKGILLLWKNVIGYNFKQELVTG